MLLTSYTSPVEKTLFVLWQREQDYQLACQEDADAEHLFKMKQAKEFLKAEGGVEVRKAIALIACEMEHDNHLHQKAILAFTKEKLKDAQQALTARQSLLAAAVKSDTGYAQTGT